MAWAARPQGLAPLLLALLRLQAGGGAAPAQEEKGGCNAYMVRFGCDWTAHWNCPGQLPGTKGQAVETSSMGYMCCCRYELWREPWSGPVPIIIDTDIGDDFDDSWALAMAVSSPDKWDVKMILTAAKDTTARAQIVAKYLGLYNRTDIPIGIGVRTPGAVGDLYPWAENTSLDAYAGPVYEDGIKATVDMLMASAEPINIIELAPATNLCAILRQYPAAVAKVRMIYAMFGAVDRCYDQALIPSNGSCPEFNVAQDVVAAQATLAAPWPLTVTPLDTCAIRMTGGPWQRLQAAGRGGNAVASALMESLSVWSHHGYPRGSQGSDFLYDAVAMYSSYSQARFQMQDLQLKVTHAGATVRSPSGKSVAMVSDWASGGQEGFLWDLADMILSAQPGTLAGQPPPVPSPRAMQPPTQLEPGQKKYLETGGPELLRGRRARNEFAWTAALFACFGAAGATVALWQRRRAGACALAGAADRRAVEFALVDGTLYTPSPWPPRFPAFWLSRAMQA